MAFSHVKDIGAGLAVIASNAVYFLASHLGTYIASYYLNLLSALTLTGSAALVALRIDEALAKRKRRLREEREEQIEKWSASDHDHVGSE